MPPSGVPSGRYYGESAAHRKALRQAIRLVARQMQALRAKVHDLELAAERLRDRGTLPTPEQASATLSGRWQVVWNALKAAEKSLADYLAMFV